MFENMHIDFSRRYITLYPHTSERLPYSILHYVFPALIPNRRCDDVWLLLPVKCHLVLHALLEQFLMLSSLFGVPYRNITLYLSSRWSTSLIVTNLWQVRAALHDAAAAALYRGRRNHQPPKGTLWQSVWPGAERGRGGIGFLTAPALTVCFVADHRDDGHAAMAAFRG